MGDVTQFPGGRRPPTLPPYGDPWEPTARAADERYMLAILEKRLPAEAMHHIARLDLVPIISEMLCAVDMARHERRLNPDYDEHRAGGELGALERLFGGPPREPEPPEPAGAA